MRRRFLGELAIYVLGIGFCSGCSAPPREIGTYKIEKGAGLAIQGYITDRKGELYVAAEHVLSVVDDGDGIINYDEAIRAVELVRPYCKSFLDGLNSIGSEKDKRENNETVGKNN